MIYEKQITDIDWEIEFPGIDFYDIQKKIITDDLDKTGIFLGTGVGKTLPTLVLAEGKILVICLKQQKLDETWQDNSKKFGLGKEMDVINYDMFWRKWEEFGQYDTIILDEGHRALGVLPETRQRNRVQIPKASKTFEAIYSYLQKYPPKRLYIVTATPASKPMKAWACAKLLGKNWDFFKFRSTFYFATMKGRRQLWMARTDEATQQRLALAVQKLGYTGALNDFMDVPEQKHIEVPISLTPDQKKALKRVQEEEADPLVVRARMRTIENGILYGKKVIETSDKTAQMVKDTQYFKSEKIDYILERAEEFPKLFIFAAYTAQVELIAKTLTDAGYSVRTVTGQTKDRATVFKELEAAPKGIAVVQAAICEGYRVPSAPCMIFASKSSQFLHFDQGKGRILDGQHLKKNLYIHLVVKGGADEDCHKNIMAGRDFQEKLSLL
jgi:hypothetical protein